MTMDDPTTYLYRDPANKAIVLAKSLALAQEACREYGCAIQCALNDATHGVFVVTELAHAQNAAATLPLDTPWATVGVDDGEARLALYRYFSNPLPLGDALGVKIEGVAWRPDTWYVP